MLRASNVWLLGALLAASGCDVVFRVDRLDPRMPDAPPDQVGCEPGAHDEDGDDFGDACDLCPGIPDDQSDLDNDGVGDACDPSATTVDHLALFIPFSDGDQPWRVASGNWVLDGESFVYDSVTLNGYGIAYYEGWVPTPPFVLEYHFDIDVILQQASGMSVLLDSDDMGRGITCDVQRHESPIRDVIRTTYAVAVLGSETTITSLKPGGYRVTATYDPADEIRCALAADDQSTGGATTLGLPTLPAAGALAVRSFRVGAKVHYIAIYKRS